MGNSAGNSAGNHSRNWLDTFLGYDFSSFSPGSLMCKTTDILVGMCQVVVLSV